MKIKTEHEALVSRKITSQLLWHNQQCYFLKQQTLLIYRNLIFLRDNYELDPAVNITYLEREEMSWLTHCPVTPVSVRTGIPSPSSLSPAPTFRLKQVIPHLDLFTVLPHIHSFKKKKNWRILDLQRHTNFCSPGKWLSYTHRDILLYIYSIPLWFIIRYWI